MNHLQKVIRLFFIFLISISLHFQSKAGTGGPDAFGYTWIDSAEPMGPTFNWIDLTTTPGAVQVMGLVDDNSVGPVPIGFDFRYYWTDYNELKIGSNGWLSFDNVNNVAHCFPTIPSAGGAGDNILAPFMSDLNFAGVGNPGQVWVYSNNSDQFIISFINVPYWVNGVPDYAGSNSFQVILSGTDNSITFQYLTTTAFLDNVGCSTDLVIGIENLTGNIGLLHSVESQPTNNYAIQFIYPNLVTLMVMDATPLWNQNDLNMVEIVDVNQPIGLVSEIGNVGNETISNVTVDGQITKISDLSNVFTDSDLIASLNSNESNSIGFSPDFIPTEIGTYDFQVQTSSAQDINPSNNLNSTELLVIDCSQSVTLDYSLATVPTGQWSWNPPGLDQNGLGVFYDLPREPFTLDSVDIYISGPVGVPHDFRVKIIANDNPVPGNGTVLASIDVTNAEITPNAFNTIDFNGLEITSDGFFVFWTTSNVNTALGTSSAGPYSMAGYEILSNTWARYRNNDNSEFMVRVHGLCPEPALIPTMGQWGIMILSLLLIIIGTTTIRKTRKSKLELFR